MGELGEEKLQFRERLTMPAATFAATSVDVADLVLLGLLRRTWGAFEEQVELGLALEALDTEPVSADDVRAAATQFRYAHNLVSARDFTAWLGARALRTADLSGVLRRRLLRERGPVQTADGARPDASTVLWAEAVCTGVLRDLALAAADLLAAAHRLTGRSPRADGESPLLLATLHAARERRSPGLPELGEPDLRARLTRLLELEDALAALRTEVADEQAISRCMASHLLDWLQIEGHELAFESESAAREARLLYLDDGLSLGEVAELAGTALHERRLVLDHVPAEATAALVAAAPGELAGPWPEADRWRIFLVSAKERPSVQVPELRERAAREVLRDILDRTLAGNTTWPLAL
jgi:hypothetical protein